MFRYTFVLAALATQSMCATLIHGVDSATLVSEATFTKAKAEDFTKAVIRGFEEACGSGGEVDPNFVSTYNNARAAGYTNIDTYWFPCNGSGNKCKSYADQISLIGQTFDAHKMKIGTIWIDFEKNAGDVCNPWNYGTSSNLAQAKELIAAAKASGYKFGIYTSPSEWSNIFGSYGVVLDHSYPLWFATWDDNDSSLKLSTPFGGWTSAVGKQYTNVSASGKFDLDIFLSTA